MPLNMPENDWILMNVWITQFFYNVIFYEILKLSFLKFLVPPFN